MTSDRYAAHLDRHLSELQAHLANGTYCPQPLKPMTVTRHGKQRHLGLSTVRDRIAQRCFLEVYARELDAANAESSFAYRKGRSWLDALARVERYRDAGLRTVFRGDIAEFFDRIDHEVLRLALTDLLSDDRAVALAMSWMTAPVLGRNGMEPRTRGVPLGAPVSPALANLYLTGFDREINSRRSGGVRYADDLVVCCVDAASAEAARFDVEQSLRPLHLELNATKTYVSSFETGFSFLGWVFFRGDGFEEVAHDEWTHPMTRARNRPMADPLFGPAGAPAAPQLSRQASPRRKRPQ